jgi:hypothetical protein
MSYTINEATVLCVNFRRMFTELVPVFSMESPRSLTGNHNRDLSSCIRLSFDKKETWTNGIYENSRYATFMVDWAQRKVKLLSSHGCENFRLYTFKDAAGLAKRLSEFVRANTKTA